jgi:hypothetical protein
MTLSVGDKTTCKDDHSSSRRSRLPPTQMETGCGSSKFFLPLPRNKRKCRELASGEVEIVLTRVQGPDAVRLMPGIASCCRAGGPFRIASDLTLTPIDVHTLASANRMVSPTPTIHL